MRRPTLKSAYVNLGCLVGWSCCWRRCYNQGLDDSPQTKVMLFKGCKCKGCKAMAVTVLASWSIVTFAHHDPFCWKQRGVCAMPWDVTHGHHDDHPTDWIGSTNSLIAPTSGSSSNVIHLKAADFSIGSPVFEAPVLTVRSGPA